jgi:hypothetical protein
MQDPYFTIDTSLLTGTFRYFGNTPVLVRGKIHLAEEKYRKTDAETEIVPLHTKQGTCIYVNMKAYVLVPDIVLTVELYPKQLAGHHPAIGDVMGSTENPQMKEQEIGDGQAWYYPDDNLLVLWECGFYTHFEDKPIHEDRNMRELWKGFETFLVSQFPQATAIATTYADPGYPTEEYQQFLTSLGYQPHHTAKAAWSKKTY